VAAFSALITKGVKPAKVQRASLEVVRNAFAICMFMRCCTLFYTVLLHSFASANVYLYVCMYVCIYVYM
jgi:hypothetical protein